MNVQCHIDPTATGEPLYFNCGPLLPPTGLEVIVASDLHQAGIAVCLDHDRRRVNADQIGQADCNIAGEIDREIGDPVAVGVALQRGDAGGAVVEIVEFAGRAVEGGGGDELELIVAAGAADRVDTR